MAEAAWEPFALLAALLANANRDPKKSKATAVEDWNPYAVRQAPRRTKIPFSALRTIFVKGQPPPELLERERERE